MPSIINATTSTGLVTTADNSGSLQLATNSGTTALTINTSQNMGVGITSPTARLHVYGGSNNQFKVESSGAEANFTLAGTSYGQINNSVGDWYLTNDASANMIFRTASTERMRIDSSGNLLVGTTTSGSFANYKTTSFGGGSAGTILQLQGSSGQDGAHVRLEASSGSPTTLTIQNRTANPIDVVANTGGVRLSSGGTSWGAISDENLKDIIEPITNATEKVSTLRAVIGKYKTDEEGTRRSFLIAQDVQAVLPEAVVKNENETLILQYTDVIPLLVASIKELNEKVEQQAIRIAELEGAK